MVAEAADAPRWTNWGAERHQPWWIRWLAHIALVFAAIGVGVGILSAAEIIPGANIAVTAVTMTALAGITGVSAFAARWVHAALSGRVDILSQALEASPDAQLVLDPAGRIVYANTAFNDLFPNAGTAPLARIAEAIADSESSDDFARLQEKAMAGSRAIAGLPLRDARGAAAGWFNIEVNPIVGRPGYSFWNLQDITARHEMETVIHDERNRVVDFFDDAPVGFYSVDAEGRFLFVNETLAGWLDSTPAEIVGSGAVLHDFLATPPAPGTAPSDPIGESGPRGEVVLKSRDGRNLPVSIGQTKVGSGAELRTRSVVRDLTPEREWETALRLSRERFQRFFANAPVGIALIDRFGRLEEANRALAELFGAVPQDLIGQPLIGFVTEDDRRAIAVKLAETADGPVAAVPVEVRLKGPRERTCVVFLSRLDGADGGDGGLMLHFIEVTEQKSLEVQIAQSQKMQAVGQLAGGVAHDFNNLLTAMIGFCDLLLMRFRPGDPSFADIMQIKQNANRAANLVRQLLAFSRQQTLQPRILDMTDVLVELSHLLRRLIGENIELKVVHGRDLGLVKVDQGQLEQVIINLAVNARDAMSGGGTLTIRTDNISHANPLRRGAEVMPAGDYVTVEVADTGIGIPKANLARIFEPFFSTKEIGSGTGLGLSTVYGIVKQTGGFIHVDSAPGKGAVFQIYLPRHQLAETALAARAEPMEPPSAKDLTGIGTVMLVEDEDPVRIFGARALRNKGYTVIEAKSGESALELIRGAERAPDLVITDVVMPRMDGPGLIREVREIHPDMKVIFISGYAEDSFRQKLDSDSDIHFLPKPFSLKQLATKVKDVISGEVA
ncbi:MAG TPA: PAS domain-containing protein [Stellaceae bacterium]|jgi:two-component system cell cycle sensor histidine kinase/response regulator CckA|nr:PAS domain-containing protein [Stellaceae bacterium]